MSNQNHTRQKVAGVVVLYNDDTSVLKNIETYLHQVDKLYAVDNSQEIDTELETVLRENKKISLHCFEENRGVASALNWAVNEAIQDGYSFLLTMDNDTKIPNDTVYSLTEFLNNYPTPIGILSGVHHSKPDKVKFHKKAYTLTSGNLLNLEVVEKVGAFRDDFFIDHIDHEYGLRLNLNGYHVIELPSIRLDHKLGYSTSLEIFNWKLKSYGTHSPIRLYYFARNGVYLSCLYFREYPLFAWVTFKEILKRFVKAILIHDDTRKRLSMLMKGLIDGWRGRLGRFEES